MKVLFMYFLIYLVSLCSMKEIIGFDTLRLKLFLELKGLKALVMGVFKDLVVIKSFEALVLPLLYLFL